MINEKDGDVQHLSFYKHDTEDSKYYLLVKGNATFFEVHSSNFDVFQKQYTDLKK